MCFWCILQEGFDSALIPLLEESIPQPDIERRHDRGVFEVVSHNVVRHCARSNSELIPGTAHCPTW